MGIEAMEKSLVEPSEYYSDDPAINDLIAHTTQKAAYRTWSALSEEAEKTGAPAAYVRAAEFIIGYKKKLQEQYPGKYVTYEFPGEMEFLDLAANYDEKYRRYADEDKTHHSELGIE